MTKQRRRRRARDKEDEASKEFLLKTAQTLRLEFRRILKVENLGCLSSLTRLFLDNNFIERIGGLDQLFHLTWLDLSFNRIRHIEGLESLKYANGFSTMYIHTAATFPRYCLQKVGGAGSLCKRNFRGGELATPDRAQSLEAGKKQTFLKG